MFEHISGFATATATAVAFGLALSSVALMHPRSNRKSNRIEPPLHHRINRS